MTPSSERTLRRDDYRVQLKVRWDAFGEGNDMRYDVRCFPLFDRAVCGGAPAGAMQIPFRETRAGAAYPVAQWV